MAASASRQVSRGPPKKATGQGGVGRVWVGTVQPKRAAACRSRSAQIVRPMDSKCRTTASISSVPHREGSWPSQAASTRRSAFSRCGATPHPVWWLKAEGSTGSSPSRTAAAWAHSPQPVAGGLRDPLSATASLRAAVQACGDGWASRASRCRRKWVGGIEPGVEQQPGEGGVLGRLAQGGYRHHVAGGQVAGRRPRPGRVGQGRQLGLEVDLPPGLHKGGRDTDTSVLALGRPPLGHQLPGGLAHFGCAEVTATAVPPLQVPHELRQPGLASRQARQAHRYEDSLDVLWREHHLARLGGLFRAGGCGGRWCSSPR